MNNARTLEIPLKPLNEQSDIDALYQRQQERMQELKRQGYTPSGGWLHECRE